MNKDINSGKVETINFGEKIKDRAKRFLADTRKEKINGNEGSIKVNALAALSILGFSIGTVYLIPQNLKPREEKSNIELTNKIKALKQEPSNNQKSNQEKNPESLTNPMGSQEATDAIQKNNSKQWSVNPKTGQMEEVDISKQENKRGPLVPSEVTQAEQERNSRELEESAKRDKAREQEKSKK